MAHTKHRRKIDKESLPVAYKRKTRTAWQREYNIVVA